MLPLVGKITHIFVFAILLFHGYRSCLASIDLMWSIFWTLLLKPSPVPISFKNRELPPGNLVSILAKDSIDTDIIAAQGYRPMMELVRFFIGVIPRYHSLLFGRLLSSLKTFWF